MPPCPHSSNLEALLRDHSVLHVDEPIAGECTYCGCDEDHACWLDQTSRERISGDWAPEGTISVPCSWHRPPDESGFAVCSAASCVRVYLADPTAPGKAS